MSECDERVRRTFLASVQEVKPLIEQHADQAEHDRQLPPTLVRALADAGLWRLTVPQALGGAEASPAVLIPVLEELARIDGSVGWCVMAAAHVGATVGYLDEEAGAAMFKNQPRACMAGVAMTSGRAEAVDGGYRVHGRWRFASGCRHATWLAGGCLVDDSDAPRRGSAGPPVERLMVFPVADCRIVDTWQVLGLRGTGSHDMVVDGAFVPAAMSTATLFQEPRYPGTLYVFGVGFVPVTMAAVALGIASGALDAFAELAGAKGVGSVGRLLRDDPLIQAQVGGVAASLAASRAFLYTATREAWRAVAATGSLSDAQRGRLFLAGAHATALSAQAVDALWNAAGTAGIFLSSPLERRLRDVRVAAQHPFIGVAQYGEEGRRFLRVT